MYVFARVKCIALTFFILQNLALMRRQKDKEKPVDKPAAQAGAKEEHANTVAPAIESQKSNKRRKLGMDMYEIFACVHKAISAETAPALVLSPRSLFQMLCTVHHDTYPDLLQHSVIASATDSLPTSR